MTATIAQPPAARLAGALYWTIIIAAMVGQVLVRDRLIIVDDPAGTVRSIQAAPLLYRAGTAIDLIVLFCDTGLAMLLYLLLKPVNEGFALLAAFFRLIFVAVMAVAAIFYFAPLTIIQDMTVASVTNRQNLTALFLKLHGIGYDIALVFFGVHCLLVGVLIARSVIIPPLIGALMIAAGACYIINSSNNFLPTALSLPLFPYILLPGLVGEAALAGWLLFRGVDRQDWARQTEVPIAASEPAT